MLLHLTSRPVSHVTRFKVERGAYFIFIDQKQEEFIRNIFASYILSSKSKQHHQMTNNSPQTEPRLDTQTSLFTLIMTEPRLRNTHTKP
ncbi:hypothetical protein Scep_005516 [Stephania cephalantha]|uniref:Uncharacterized protein n=1 Tax=Stephania cephalantha TaxID=152367 RepID=A0AAP0KW60_9MAGN